MPRAQKAGFPTYWTQYGQGPRAALMLHCSLAHSGAWGGVARYLSGALTMTAFDLPGHGRSADWDGRGDFQDVTTAIAAEFAAETGPPLDLIGHSFGAVAALRLAVERPELVRSLVLIEPVFFAVARCGDRRAFVRHEAAQAGYEAALATGDRMDAAREFTALWGAGKPWEAMSDGQRQALAERIPLIAEGTPALNEDPAGMLEPGVLERVDLPVLLIEGSASPEVISTIHERLAARLPRARRAVIAGAGHMAPITHAMQVSDEILRFLGAGPS